MTDEKTRSVLRRVEQGDTIRVATAGGSVEQSSGEVNSLRETPDRRTVHFRGPSDGRYDIVDDGDIVKQYHIRSDGRIHDWGEVEMIAVVAVNNDADPDAGDGMADLEVTAHDD